MVIVIHKEKKEVDGSMRRKLPVLVLAVALILSLVPLLQISNQPVAAQGPILIERGPNFQRWDLGDGKFAWESAPQWIQADNGSWVPCIFNPDASAKDSGDPCFSVQTGLIATEIMKDYPVAKFWNPAYTEVRIYEEWWAVEYWKDGQWKDTGVGAQMPTYTFVENVDGIFITRTQTLTNVGELEIRYEFRVGSMLKHTVVYTNLGSTTYNYRVLQKWAGIVGNKVRHIKDENTITGTTIIDSPFFEFRDENGKMTVLELQHSMYYDENGSKLTEHNLKPVVVDVHTGNQMKADFIFENWTLTQNESLTIDPSTVTLSNPTEDGFISFKDGYTRFKNDDTAYIGVDAASATRRSYFEWNEVERAYYWVCQNIAYEPDVDGTAVEFIGQKWVIYENDIMSSPAETLEKRAGDCEDMAILLVSMLRQAGVPCENVRVVLGTFKTEKAEYGHSWAEVAVGGYWVILDPTAMDIRISVAGNYDGMMWLNDSGWGEF